MVNNLKNISCYDGLLPADIASEGADRHIAGGPLYTVDQVQAVLGGGGSKLLPWTGKCRRDLQDKLSMDLDDAAELVRQAIQRGRFKGAEWCCGKAKHLWAACDAYVLTRSEWNRHAHRDLEVEYYVKFSVKASGDLLLLISCHNPEQR